MADNNLDTKLQALEALIENTRDSLIATKAGVSLLVQNGISNPLTAPAFTPSKAHFNFSAAGDKALKKLMSLVPIDEFKQLENLDSAGLLDKLESNIEAQANKMVQSVGGQVTAAVNAQVAALEQQVTAIANQATAMVDKVNSIARDLDATVNKISADQALQAAVDSGAPAGEIAQLTDAKNQAEAVAGAASQRLENAINTSRLADSLVDSATGIVNNTTAELSSIMNAVGAATGFMKTLGEIAKGKTDSSVIRNSGSVDTSTTTATSTSSVAQV